MTQRTKGRLDVVGVGPGDPDLLTVKAVKALAAAHRVFAARSSRNAASLGLRIAREHLPPGTPVEHLDFPMTHDAADLRRAWELNAALLLESMETCGRTVFLTLGDPCLYSTFGYIQTIFREWEVEADIRIIPGITSFQAAAARTGTMLAQDRQTLLVAPATADLERLGRLLELADAGVVLKAYRNMADVRGMIEELGLTGRSVFVSRLGLDGEVVRRLAEAPDAPHYFSLILVGR